MLRPELQALLRHPRVARIAALLGCLLCVPSLWLGLIADDLAHRRFVLSHLDGTDRLKPFWDMFDVCGRTPPPFGVPFQVYGGLLPWWTSRSFSMAFLRPLAAATHYLDYALWPRAPWLMHAHNLAWYALIVVLAARLYRRLIGDAAIAGLSALLYAIDEAHVDGASWIAGRNTLMTAAFSLLALLSFDHFRRGGEKRALAVHAIAMLCALASSEGALGVFGYLIAYAVVLERGPLGQRLQPLWPATAISVAWLALAAAFGYGVRGSGLYVDPRSDPLAFLAITAQRFPDVLRAQFAIPVELVRPLPAAGQTACALFGTAVLLSMVLCVPRLRASASARFFALGLVVSALPICAGGAEPRLLFLVGFGAHGLVAECVWACMQGLGGSRLVRGGRALLVGLLLFLHVPVALAGAPLTFVMWSTFDAKLRAATASLPGGAARERDAILVLNTGDYLVNMFVAMYRLAPERRGPALMHVLGASEARVRLSRPERNRLVLEPEGGYLLEHASKVVRSPRERFAPGETVLLLGLVVRVEGITPDGRPARIRLELGDADDPRLLWVSWNRRTERFDRVRLPAVGSALWL